MGKFFLSLSAVLLGLAFTGTEVLGKGSKGSRSSGGQRSSAGRSSQRSSTQHRSPSRQRQGPSTHRSSPGTKSSARRSSGTPISRKTKTGTAKVRAPKHVGPSKKPTVTRRAPKHVTPKKKATVKGPRRPSRTRPGLGKAKPRKNLTAKAMHKHDGPRKNLKHSRAFRNYHLKKGKQFTYKLNGATKKGWFYAGKNHHHWQSVRWNSQFRKWFLYDPCAEGWFCYSSRCDGFVPAPYYCCTDEYDVDDADDPTVLPCGETVGDGDEIVAVEPNDDDAANDDVTE